MSENDSIDRDDLISLDIPRPDRDRDGVDSLRDTEAEQGDDEESTTFTMYDESEGREAGADLDGDALDEPRLD